MSLKPNDGGPAFPNRLFAESEGTDGMSLRAHFAGLALQGMMANGFMPNQAIHTHARYLAQKDKDYNYAAAAVEMADALIAELAKETT